MKSLNDPAILVGMLYMVVLIFDCALGINDNRLRATSVLYYIECA